MPSSLQEGDRGSTARRILGTFLRWPLADGRGAAGFRCPLSRVKSRGRRRSTLSLGDVPRHHAGEGGSSPERSFQEGGVLSVRASCPRSFRRRPSERTLFFSPMSGETSSALSPTFPHRGSTHDRQSGGLYLFCGRRIRIQHRSVDAHCVVMRSYIEAARSGGRDSFDCLSNSEAQPEKDQSLRLLITHHGGRDKNVLSPFQMRP